MSTPNHKSNPSLESYEAVFVLETGKPDVLANVWAVLTPEQRRQAIKGAEGYAIHCRDNRRRPMDPAKFLHMPDLWAEFALIAPGAE